MSAPAAFAYRVPFGKKIIPLRALYDYYTRQEPFSRSHQFGPAARHRNQFKNGKGLHATCVEAEPKPAFIASCPAGNRALLHSCVSRNL
jgi:hypothetical protein